MKVACFLLQRGLSDLRVIFRNRGRGCCLFNQLDGNDLHCEWTKCDFAAVVAIDRRFKRLCFASDCVAVADAHGVVQKCKKNKRKQTSRQSILNK